MLKQLIRRALILGANAIALPFLSMSTAIAAPEFCPDTANPPPARTLREVQLKQFGIKVQVPANYRTLLRNDGTVSILAPGDFNLIQCLAKGMPVKGTDTIQMDTIQRRPNPNQLNLKDYVTQTPDSKFSPKITSVTVNRIDVLVRELPEQAGILEGSAHAWYQVNGIDGIIEMNTTYKTDLFDLLKRTQLLSEPSTPQTSSQPPAVSSASNDNLVQMAIASATDLGYQPNVYRETILRQNNSVEGATQSTVTITQEGLLDDSITGHQFIVQFQRTPGAPWEMTNLQKKRKCQPGRGAQAYSTELCN